jgi:adenylate cyclase
VIIGPFGLDAFVTYPGIIANVPQIENSAAGVGIVNTLPEVDGVVRRMPMIVRLANELYPSFPLEIIRVATSDPSYQIKTGEAGIEAVRIPQFPTITTDLNGRIWLSQNAKFERVEAIELNTSKVDLTDKIVIVGLTAEGLGTVIGTPRGEIYAHDLQAQALQTLISGTTISRPAIADLAEIFAFGAWGQTFSSLDLMSHVLGVPTSKDNLDGSKVHNSFWVEKAFEEIKDYCEKDVLCTMNCFKKISS